MIVVTGTGRSGTSMLMQALAASGLPIIGEKFPKRFSQRLAKANPEGFYESPMRDTGVPDIVDAETSRNHAVKLFLPGVLRTDVRYLDRVILTMRPVREFVRSQERLRSIDSNGRASRVEMAPPEAIWWRANHALLMDAWRRGYPLKVVAYENVLADPAGFIGGLVQWIGAGDAEKAVRTVNPRLRTQRVAQTEALAEDIDARDVDTFDELYALVRDGRQLTPAMVAKMGATNERMRRRAQARKERRAEKKRERREARGEA